MSPQFQKFKKAVKEKFGDNIPQQLRDDFRSGSLPLMKYTNILTFNTRAIALYVSLLIKMPWLYVAFEIIVLSLIFFYMRACHEKLSRTLYNKLDEYVTI